MKVYFGKYQLHCRDMAVGNFDIGIQTSTICDYAAESLVPIFSVADRCDVKLLYHAKTTVAVPLDIQ